MLYSVLSMNSSQYKRVKERSLLVALSVLAILFISSCEKTEDYIDNTATSFPPNWKSSEILNLVAFNVKDSTNYIRNASVAPLGTVIDGNFGKMSTNFYLNYQTTTTSKLFSFTSIDSAVLVMPYYTTLPKYGNANLPFSIEVFEMTEVFEISTTSKKTSYTYNPSPIGSKLNFIAKISDSVYDGTTKTAPAIRIPLSSSFASKIIAPGSYTDDAAFQAIVKGLYVKSTGMSSSNGFVMLSIANDNKIKIYGKNSAGASIISEFSSGGTNCTTVNEYLHDNSSLAASASSSPNMVSGDNILYGCGVDGYLNKLKLPDFKTLALTKNIFKTELTIYSVDTGFQYSMIGLMFIDSTTGKEYAMVDEYYQQNYLISKKDTTIAGKNCIQYKFNIGLLANKIINKSITCNTLNIYSAPINVLRSSTSKLSTFLPSRTILGGTTGPASPRIKIYFTEK
jgi:hypothetical protein